MQGPLLSVSELRRLLAAADPLIFDCRYDLSAPAAGRAAYRAGHVPGARYLHIDEQLSGRVVPGRTGRHPLPEPEELIDHLAAAGLGSADRAVVLYDDKGGGIAARGWWLLRALGHERVAVLDGGWPAWRAADGAIETGEPAADTAAGASPSHLAPRYTLRTCDRAQVDRIRGVPEWTLIDARTAERYRGEVEPIDPVAGHIAGAINLPWPDNLGADGRFKSREELRERFAHLRPAAERNVFYCGSGVTACHNILAYDYAYGRMPALYPGSWSEWITEEA